MISVAYAASEAGHEAAHHGGSLLENPAAWVALAFVILVVLAFKPVSRMVAAALDDRADAIKKQLDEAEQLHREAADLLAAYQGKQKEAEKEAAAIIQRARDEAERLKVTAKKSLEDSLARREKAAKERISQAEAQAIAEVKAMAADAAIKATEQLLNDNLSAPKANAMIEAAIKELPEKLGANLS